MDSKDPKRTGNAVPVGRMHRGGPSGRSVLVECLAGRVAPERARELVDEALERAGRTDAPDEADELLSFAKAHLIDDLVRAIGARGVSAFLDDVRESARLISGLRSRDSRSARAVIALVDADTFRRALTARALIAKHFEVAVAAKLEELIATPLRPEVLILEHDEALSAALYVVLSTPKFRPALVLRTREHPSAARELLERAGVENYEIVATTAPSETLAAVERLLGLDDEPPPTTRR